MTHDDFVTLMTFLTNFRDWWVEYRNVVGWSIVIFAAFLGFNTGYRR